MHTYNKFDTNDYSIKIRDKNSKYVRSTKFLGLILDDRFSYSDHVSQLVKQLSKTKGVLLKLSHVVPSFVIRKIYYGLFYSRISYNITVLLNLGFPVICSSIFSHYSVISLKVSFAVHALFL